MFVARGDCSGRSHDVMAGLIKDYLASRNQKERGQADLYVWRGCGERAAPFLLSHVCFELCRTDSGRLISAR
jgi:hypothetical protein